MTTRTLADWLEHAGTQHTIGIDLGLERVTRVASALGFDGPDYRPAARNLIVAGTNGKGSTTVFSEQLLLAAGLRVGATLSPHVHRFNERVRLDGKAVDDELLCQAFVAVEAARGSIPLTYFEYSVLVSLWIFRQAEVDVTVLEVGLGGRLDGFNLVGADVAVVTSIGLDHQDFLGSDIEVIGREKAGVMRPGRPAVIGRDVTDSVMEEARRLGCVVRHMGDHFDFGEDARHWWFRDDRETWFDLPRGVLAPYNCALAIAAVGTLVKLTEDQVRTALAGAVLPGRLESWQIDDRLMLVDVAHNPAGARFLGGQLDLRFPGQKFVAILGMLEDKDPSGVVAALHEHVAAWVCVPTLGPRGQSGRRLLERIRCGTEQPVQLTSVEDLVAGVATAQLLAGQDPGLGLLGFGSFNLVENLRDLASGGKIGLAVAAEPPAAIPPQPCDRTD